MASAAMLVLLLMASVLIQWAQAECEPATCGNLTVKYPFWLGAPSQPPPEPSCGPPAFELWCAGNDTNTTSASMRGSAVHVLRIDYAAGSFVASHTRVAAGDDGVCRTDFNMSSSLALSPFRISAANRALCFLYHCNGTEPPVEPGFVNATGCGRIIYAYLGGSYDRDTPPPIQAGTCTYAYLPALGSEAATETAADYGRMLKDGFLLEWAGAGIADCDACITSGGQCRYSNVSAGFACLCAGGRLLGSTCAVLHGIRALLATSDTTSSTLQVSTLPALLNSTSAAITTSTLGALSTASVGSMFSGSSSSSFAAADPFHFSHLLPIKLAQDNYLLWKAQILPLLRSRYLMGYVDGSYPCPPERVSRLNAEGRPVLVINPEHRTWVQQDAAILSAIVSSMTTSVSGRVLFATTAQEAWMALSTSFASQSTSQAMAILTKLAEAQKLDKTITVYFDEVQNLADTLSSIGQPLTTAQFTAYVLKGLDADYDNLVENINGRDTPIAPQDLYARLLSTEQRIAARRALTPATDFSANAAYRGRPSGQGSGAPGAGPSRPNNNSSKPPSGPLPYSNNNRSPGGGGGGNGGGGRRWNTSDGNRPLCQTLQCPWPCRCSVLQEVRSRLSRHRQRQQQSAASSVYGLSRQGTHSGFQC
nr:uncharacterized protein LOC127341105 [Lolium perenne]